MITFKSADEIKQLYPRSRKSGGLLSAETQAVYKLAAGQAVVFSPCTAVHRKGLCPIAGRLKAASYRRKISVDIWHSNADLVVVRKA